jgi:acetyl-CoA synthetase
VTATKPGSAQVPLPGIAVDVVDEAGESVPNGSGGYLVIREPWPAMLRGIWGDPERFKETYWSRFESMYFAGDGAKKDEDGDVWLLGRVDDVMNISGHRLSTTEIESALVSHPAVAEAAVVGAADDTTGQAIVAFVILRGDAVDSGDAIIQELRNHVGTEIGPIAKPKIILVVPELPKTRSGKIMRRLLKDVAEGREVGDATTLADNTVMAQIAQSLRCARLHHRLEVPTSPSPKDRLDASRSTPPGHRGHGPARTRCQGHGPRPATGCVPHDRAPGYRAAGGSRAAGAYPRRGQAAGRGQHARAGVRT